MFRTRTFVLLTLIPGYDSCDRESASFPFTVHFVIVVPLWGCGFVSPSNRLCVCVVGMCFAPPRLQFCWAAACLSDANERIDVPLPAVLKPVPLWTGKQLYSLIMSPNEAETVRVNLNFKERHYDDDSMMHKAGYPVMCPAEGYVVIRNGCDAALLPSHARADRCEWCCR
jgi:hypothetical protein